jgi:hypothetical protein
MSIQKNLCQFVLYHVGNCVNLYQFREGFPSSGPNLSASFRNITRLVTIDIKTMNISYMKVASTTEPATSVLNSGRHWNSKTF